MLKASRICKKYGQLVVLDNINIEVEQGAFVAIVGPSGAGKSTLLHLLGALDTPDSGTILLNGTDIFQSTQKKMASFRNKHIGFVFQSHHLLPEFTALENVSFPLWIAGEKGKLVENKAKEALERVGLAHREKHRPSELSGGEQQRVAIARAIINRPSVVFADEPTGNLDSANALSIHELFLELRRHYQQTFIVVTHNEQLANLADRKIHMKDGNIK